MPGFGLYGIRVSGLVLAFLAVRFLSHAGFYSFSSAGRLGATERILSCLASGVLGTIKYAYLEPILPKRAAANNTPSCPGIRQSPSLNGFLPMGKDSVAS